MRNGRYKSANFKTVHEGVAGLFRQGLVDKATMRRFDAACLAPLEPFGPEEVQALRERERASPAVLARHLNVPTSVVEGWERGERRPTGAALKLLWLAKSNGLDSIR